MNYSPILETFRERIIPTASSPKFKRPRAPFYMERWCPWIRAHSPKGVTYLYLPHSSSNPSPKYSMELISKARKELGSAGFYHSILVRRLWNTVWKTVVKMSGNPELPMEGSELPEPHEEVIEGGVAIIAGDGAGLKLANRVVELTGNNVVLIATKPFSRLKEESGEGARGNVTILESIYLGKFEDGVYALSEEKREIYRIAANTLAFVTGVRDAMPIFENNDLPGVVSAELAKFLIVGHGALRDVRKIAVLSNDKRGLEAAREFSRFKETTVVSVGSLKKRESIDWDGELVVAEEVKATGYPVVEGLKIISPKEEELQTDLIVSAITGIPDIEPVLQAGGRLVYSKYLGAPTVGTEKGYVKGTKNLFFLGRASGTPEDLVSKEVELVSKVISGKSLSSEEEKELNNIQSSKGLAPLEDTIINNSPELLLTRDIRGMKFVCTCQDVTLEDVILAYDMGYKDLERIKRFTALGTGTCQGRICRISSSLAISYFRKTPLGSLGGFKQRPPLEPVELGMIY
ncbi:MAG: (2Fe-2S)-binding protein [Desulfurococcales archaeon]|uniref:SoxA A3 domain-containing protein n=1 Tax=Fervidicoccus fontis TaxID=683846 RepID=A0A7J3SK99_9CREN